MRLIFFISALLPNISLAQSPAVTDQYATSAQWLSLLYMSSRILGGHKSRVESGSRFFLSPTGHSDPQSELQATIDAFQSAKEYKPDENPLCQFPARARALTRDLGLKFSKPNCPSLQRWRAKMEADDFVIIYSSQYISNPASMMGHTFLKFVRKGREDYLNRALGYAADMDEGVGAFAYIFKGLFGGFKGAWPENLYYEKVHEYNDMESRDMWEFRLNLTTEQREFLIDHIWELKNLADLNYFFIDENCSYVVLATLQAVLPEKDLLSAFPFYVVPLETAKKLDREGLISGQTYRPSLRNQTLSKYLALNESEQDEVRDSLRQQRIVSSKNSLVSETVIDFLDLKRQRQQGRLDPATTDFEKRIQSQRATLGQHPPLAIETPPSPLQGHRTFQAYLGLGQTDSMRKYGVLGFKPGVHGYFDKDQGYLKNSSFSFFETEVEWDKELSLSHLTLIDVGSMNAYSRLDPVFSWRFQTGLRKDQGLSNRKLSTYDVRPQWGISWDLSRDFDLSILGTALWQPVEFGGNAHRFWLGPHIEGSWRLQNKFKWVQQIALLKEFLEKENLTGAFLNSELRFFDFVNHWHLGASVTWNQFFTLRPNFFDFKGTVQFDF